MIFRKRRSGVILGKRIKPCRCGCGYLQRITTYFTGWEHLWPISYEMRCASCHTRVIRPTYKSHIKAWNRKAVKGVSNAMKR